MIAHVAAAVLVAALTLLPPAAASAADATLTPADRRAAFEAAGFEPRGAQWIRCEEDPPTASYMAGRLEVVDLNGDGRPEAWITEGSVFCYGDAGSAVVLVTRDAGGHWRKVLDEVGVARALDTKHLGWPDVEVGGPGLGKMPVHRWNGTSYAAPR
jgi:hypothetical protein